MKKLILTIGILFVLCNVSGCGSDSHEAYVKDMIDVLKDARRALAKIAEAKKRGEQEAAKKAKEVAPELREAGERLRSIQRKAENLKEPLSEDEKKRLTKEWRDKFQEAMKNVAAEWDAVKDIKGVRETLDREGALVNWGAPR
jgi:hypothetical protein